METAALEHTRSGPMTVSSSAYISAMRQFSAAVNIITTGSGDERAGFTATAVFSLTADPPQIAISVNHAGSAFLAIGRNGHFCVNTLASDQEPIASRFSGSAKGEARFDGARWTTLITGSPALVGALVNFDCVEVGRMTFSTHTLIIGQVEAVFRGDAGRPLLYVNGQWASLAPATLAAMHHATRLVNHSIETVDHALAENASTEFALDQFVKSFAKHNIDEQSGTNERIGLELYARSEDLSALHRKRRSFDDAVHRLIRRGIEEGRFHVDDARITSFALIGMIVWTYKWYRQDGRLSPAEIGDKLAAIARRMVGAS